MSKFFAGGGEMMEWKTAFRTDEFWETIESETSTWKDFREKFVYEFGERKTAGEHLCELTKITRTKGEPFNVLL